MTWSEFKTAVREQLPLDSARYNVGIAQGAAVSYLDRKMRIACLEIQDYVPLYRQGHSTTWGVDDVEDVGYASHGFLPENCFPVAVEVRTTGTPCTRRPVAPYSYERFTELTCGVPSVMNCEALIGIDTRIREFWLYPKLDQDDTQAWELSMIWDGKKVDFADSDLVPFDEEMAGCVADFVKWRIEIEVNRDVVLGREYEKMYVMARSKLFASANARKSMTVTNTSSATGKSCASTYPCYGTGAATPTPPEPPIIDFVAFGDFGDDSANEAVVAGLVKSLKPQFLLFLGDILYPDGKALLIEDRLLKYYDQYVPELSYPVWGNHDLQTDEGFGYGAALASVYPLILALNEGKLYYQKKFGTDSTGSVEIFVLNSGYTDADPREADGITSSSVQALWLQTELAASTATWKIVAMHRPPYCSDEIHYDGSHAMRWPFKEWGADLILAGHGHNYERLLVGGLPIIISGLGGVTKRGFHFAYPTGIVPVDGSQYRYWAQYGALRLTADSRRLQATFHGVDGSIIDNVTYAK